MLIASPIPPGYTVIARPMIGSAPFTMTQEQIRPLPPSMIKESPTNSSRGYLELEIEIQILSKKLSCSLTSGPFLILFSVQFSKISSF